MEKKNNGDTYRNGLQTQSVSLEIGGSIPGSKMADSGIAHIRG